MSESTELYSDIKQTLRHWRAGKIKDQDADKELRFFKEMARVLALRTSIGIHGYPNGGKPFLNHLNKARIISSDEAIPLLPESIEYERLLCEHNREEITRGECLEREGIKETDHEECKGCEIGIINKKLLCPPEQGHI